MQRSMEIDHKVASQNTEVRTSLVVEVIESTYQCRGHRFDPWSRQIPHAMDQLSSCTAAPESGSHSYQSPQHLQPVFHSKRGHCSEKQASQQDSAQLQGALRQQRGLSALKNQ